MNKEKDIPKEFMMGGQLINVETFDKLPDDNSGLCVVYENKIKLARYREDTRIDPKYRRKVFHHELVHLILLSLGYDELSDNETFVESFAALLDQYIETRKF